MPVVDDEQRLIAAYRALEKPLYNVVYRRLWHAEESMDVVQQAFLECWRRREHWREDIKPYLFKIALNLAAKRRRWLRIRHILGLEQLNDEDARCAGLAPDQYVEQDQLKQAMAAMPIGLRDVLLLSEVGGLTYAEIAQSLNIKEGTVGSRRYRARRWLSQYFAGDEHE